EVEPVGGIVVGADGFRIAVDHDGLEAGVLQRVGGVDAAVVELDPLADAVGTAAEDDDFLAFGGIGLAGRRAVAAFIGGIHVGRRAGEFRRTGVDTFVDWV